MEKSKNHICFTKKDEDLIDLWLGLGILHSKIVRRLGFHRSSVSPEITRGLDSQGVYQSIYAEGKSVKRVRSRVLNKRKILSKWEDQFR